MDVKTTLSPRCPYNYHKAIFPKITNYDFNCAKTRQGSSDPACLQVGKQYTRVAYKRTM
jgi:hypothetical protein